MAGSQTFAPEPPAGPRETWDKRLWGGTVPIVTLGVMLASGYLWVTGQPLPPELVALGSALVGYWIGGEGK